MEEFCQKTKIFFLSLIVFLFPLFFLPITQEFFLTNKLYLLAFGGFFLLFLSTISFLLSKKISWRSFPFDNSIFSFLLTIILSIIIASPNKIQAILNPNFGLLMMFSLTILYFYLSRLSTTSLINYPLIISSLLLSLATLARTVLLKDSPFKNIIGNDLDLVIFLGFMIVYGLTQILIGKTDKTDYREKTDIKIIHYPLLMVNLIALSLTVYNIFKSMPTNLPPFRLSWYATVETLKQPLTALFGVGIDNFSSIFTRVKDLAYNQSNLWQINYFPVSRSALLHLFTETGLFGLLSFSLLIWQLIKIIKKNHLIQNLPFYYSLLMILFFPPSLITWFLFFIILASTASVLSTTDQHYESKTLDLTHFPPLYFGLGVIFFLLITSLTYLFSRSYLAEYYFKKGLDGVKKNNAKEVYDNTRQAIILNPFIERYRVNFSQINLIIANNIAQKANQNNDQKKTLSETDRQNITQAIQAAINEAKAAVGLNPQKADHWYNLANVYQQIINLTQGADLWTISSYQRAIVLDPQNPIYRLNLGGVYYSLGNYEDASKVFEQAVVLKPDWPNAHYNLAWADYQRGNYQRAVSEMENVLSLLNPKKDKADYEKAKKDLEEFRKKLPEEQQKATESAQPTQLNLPTPIPTTQPQIELPKEASPEAK